MDDTSWALTVGALALALWLLTSKRLDRIEREIDLIVDGDLETLKLKRKLDGYAVLRGTTEE